MCLLKKFICLSMTSFQWYSSSFYQNDCNVSGYIILVTYDLENAGQVKINKNTHYWHANNHRRCLKKMCLIFHIIHVLWKAKSVMLLWDCLTFFIFFTDYDRGARALQKKVRYHRGLLHNLVFIFQVENELHGKWNIEYLRNYASDNPQSFTMFVKIMWY